MYNLELIKTKDGSNTLFVPELNETYHSKHGAVTESKHVYIDMGLRHCVDIGLSTVNILEVGFGTGLNWFLTLNFFKNNNIEINYETLEKYPLDSSLMVEYFKDIEEFKEIDIKYYHQMAWEVNVEVERGITFLKKQSDLLEIEFEHEKFDLIYFDAFAPNKQPELWTAEVFLKIYKSLKINGFLVTYCAQGDFKRTLKKVGFQVECLPGPPFKKEMTRAFKK
ncbi:MAG: tRNA (5-methylaminomethyl-2-thiouridine)(34)-methyltransferase MnmD [Cytophagales bacterium]